METIYRDKQHRIDYTNIAASLAKREIGDDFAKEARREADARAYERAHGIEATCATGQR